MRAALFIATLLAVGCDRRAAPAPSARPTIASTVPAATDLIVGMGGRDRLVAVSTFDNARPDVGRLPKAGGYTTFDWEQLAAVHPSGLVIDIAPDRWPAGLRQHADALGIRLWNVQVNRLPDVGPAIETLGEAIGDPRQAAAARATFEGRLAAVADRAAGQPSVSALIVVSPDATMVAGPDTYLDDVLRKAGGINAAARLKPWATVDHEQLLALRPAVVIQLLTGDKPQDLATAKATWAGLPGLSARVCYVTGPYVLQPGWHLPELAEQIAACLHPPTTRP